MKTKNSSPNFFVIVVFALSTKHRQINIEMYNCTWKRKTTTIPAYLHSYNQKHCAPSGIVW